MIHSVRSNDPRFKTVKFKEGLNVVVADWTSESSDKDSRNGLGKTTLIEIIHFCLGSSIRDWKEQMLEALHDWVFTIDLELGNQIVSVSRSIAERNKVFVKADFTNFPIQPKVDPDSNEHYFSVKDWTATLGIFMFGLDITPTTKYSPTFRSLISYFIRRGSGAFLSSFENYPRQKEWDKQVSNTFLLGLQWEDASECQILKDEENGLRKLGQAKDSGVIKDFFGTLGDLEARKVRLEGKYRRQDEQLKTFKVHPQYKEIEESANLLTKEIHEASNDNMLDRQILSMYKKDLEHEDVHIKAELLIQTYEEAKVYLPDLVKKRIEDVEIFNSKLLANRRKYLTNEMARLEASISKREEIIESKTEERAYLLEILNTFGALDEYNKLQNSNLELLSQIKALETRIENLKNFEQGKSSIKIKKEMLLQKALLNYDDRKVQRERAIELFNLNSESLYEAPGELKIDITKSGYKFDVEIERSDSEGISHMKVFCYDLMLAELWSLNENTPKLLIHDSTIFDPVDERQVARALELAAAVSERCNFQYICTINSDKIPYDLFSPDFDFDSNIRLRLTDGTEEGGLLGIRF